MYSITFRGVEPWLIAVCFILGSVVGCGSCANPNNDERPDRPPSGLRAGPLVTQLRGPDELKDQYRPPTADEYLRLSRLLDELFPRLLSGATDFANLRPRLESAGLRLQTIERNDETWLVLFEGGETWRGTGAYVFRLGPDPSPVLFQAPHSYYDLHTGTITERLFEATDARGLFFNSLHRYRGATHEYGATTAHPSDVSHDTSSFFQLMTATYLHHRSDALVVQLHGYSDESLRERDIGVVLSDGTRTPNRFVERLEATLEEFLEDWDVAKYPDETDKYAATANAQGRWVQETGRGAFIHLEIIRDLRDDLHDGAINVPDFGRTVVDTMSNSRE